MGKGRWCWLSRVILCRRSYRIVFRFSLDSRFRGNDRGVAAQRFLQGQDARDTGMVIAIACSGRLRSALLFSDRRCHPPQGALIKGETPSPRESLGAFAVAGEVGDLFGGEGVDF